MIYLDNLSKSYNGNLLFSKVNISIKKGMRVGLVGANGTGKTTLLRILIGEDDFDSGGIQKDNRISIGYLPQEIISGTESTVLIEAQKSFSFLKDIEEELNSLHLALNKNPLNKNIIKKIGDLQYEYEAGGGWLIEQEAKKY